MTGAAKNTVRPQSSANVIEATHSATSTRPRRAKASRGTANGAASHSGPYTIAIRLSSPFQPPPPSASRSTSMRSVMNGPSYPG